MSDVDGKQVMDALAMRRTALDYASRVVVSDPTPEQLIAMALAIEAYLSGATGSVTEEGGAVGSDDCHGYRHARIISAGLGVPPPTSYQEYEQIHGPCAHLGCPVEGHPQPLEGNRKDPWSKSPVGRSEGPPEPR